MALNYNIQNTISLIGSRVGTTITGTALTSAYQTESAETNPTKSFSTADSSKANFNIRYGMGASETSNSLELKFETSSDGNVWHQIVNESVSGGTSTLTSREFTIVGNNGTTKDFSLPLDIADKWMRVSAKETGVVTNAGNVFVEVTLSGGN